MHQFEILGALVAGGLVGVCLGWIVKWSLEKLGFLKDEEE
jgi:F0F1-type ATP synthase assembly protein I